MTEEIISQEEVAKEQFPLDSSKIVMYELPSVDLPLPKKPIHWFYIKIFVVGVGML